MWRLLIFIAVTALAACENIDRDMYDQITVRAQKAPPLMAPVGSTPITGRPVDYLSHDPATLPPPFPFSAKIAELGRPLFNRYCSPCHGIDGKAKTKTALKMDVTPFDLTDHDVSALTNGEIFVKIITSDSLMPNFRAELSDREAWEITNYVRKLQEAQ